MTDDEIQGITDDEREDVEVRLDLRTARHFAVTIVGQEGQELTLFVRHAGSLGAQPTGVLSRIQIEAMETIRADGMRQAREAKEAAVSQQRMTL